MANKVIVAKEDIKDMGCVAPDYRVASHYWRERQGDTRWSAIAA